MWICLRCGFKNSNSNKTCHGIDCHEKKPLERIDNFVRDDCPKCKKETIFRFKRMKGKRRIYVCQECSKACYQIGKSRPVTEEILRNAN